MLFRSKRGYLLRVVLYKHVTALYFSNDDGVVWCSLWSGLMKDQSVRTAKDSDT